MRLSKLEICLMISAALIILVVVLLCTRRSGYENINEKALHPNNYQNSPPSLDVEKLYHSCVSRECSNSDDKSQCLETCRLKAYRRGMMSNDRCDLVCQAHKGDEDAFYKCLGRCYTDHRSI